LPNTYKLFEKSLTKILFFIALAVESIELKIAHLRDFGIELSVA